VTKIRNIPATGSAIGTGAALLVRLQQRWLKIVNDVVMAALVHFQLLKFKNASLCFFSFTRLVVAVLRMQSAACTRLRQSVIGRHRKFAAAEL
jgi:hypothetical protein